MKRLILVQNDCGGTGKSTLARCLQRYLDHHQVPHLAIMVTESAAPGDSQEDFYQLPIQELLRGSMQSILEVSELLLMEVDTGLAEAVLEYLESHPALGKKFELMVATPVTGDAESFAAVTQAAQILSDRAEYAVFHVPTGSEYDEDEAVWEHSRAARKMDLLDGVDIEMPAISPSLEAELYSIDLSLAESLAQYWGDGSLSRSLTAWTRKVNAQLDSARKFVFNQAFRPSSAVTAMPSARRQNASAPKAMVA